MAKLMSARIWALLIALILSVIAINPAPGASGLQIKNMKEGSELALAGLKTGETIQEINHQPIISLADYQKEITKIHFDDIILNIKTDQGPVLDTFIGNPGFITSNRTVIDATGNTTLKKGMIIEEINGHTITSDEDILNLTKQLIKKEPFTIATNKGTYSALLTQPPELIVKQAQKTNINKGLELQGGSRVIIRPVSDNNTKITDSQVEDIIAVMSNRLNVYGLADLQIRPAKDLDGTNLIVVEIAGATREEVRDLIAKQGKFEAKIGNDVVFIGGKGDIPFVCRNDGSCSGIRPPCQKVGQDQRVCNFEFAISLSDEAAKRQAAITEKLDVNVSEAGKQYLSKGLDLYLDDQLVDTLQISVDLKGRETTRIAISGPGFGASEQEAYDNALKQMNKLQTILITGSLPLKIEIEKLDTISAVLGQEFINNSILAGFAAIVAVGLVVLIRYRTIKITLPIMLTMLSEIVIILGIAALMQWSMDLPSIAGIIASVGTGVNDQIVITDEVLRGQQFLSWKEKIKRAFFIILAVYACTIAAMIPLWSAGAGLVRGFAVTTIIGVSVGVFITRPAYASVIEKILNK